MRIRYWTRILTLGALWCCQSQAVGLPHFSIGGVVSAADLIVVAEVNQVRDIGPAQPIQFRNQLLQAEAYSADLSVIRTLKGPLLEDVSLTYSLPLTFVGYSSLRRGIRIVFLRRENSQYRPADPYYPSFPASVDPPEENTASENSSQLVLSNMLAVLASNATSSSEKYEILRVDYALPGNQKTVGALRKALSTSTDRTLSERLLGELICFADQTQLSATLDLLSNNSATQDGREWLLYVIGNHVQNAGAVPTLVRLLNSPSDSVREAVVEALWHIGTPTAVPALVHELEDQDEKVQFYAVRGLSDIANEYGWGGPSEGEFHEHTQKYLEHWQEWAKNRAQ